MKNNPALLSLPIATADGVFTAHYSERGLAGINFPEKQSSANARQRDDVPKQIKAWHRLTTTALNQVVAGKPPGELPTLDLTAGTEFQRSVWKAMLRIRLGEARSYGEIAKCIGRPRAVRAVGGACGANPIPVLVPCHRVLAAGGKLGGFSSDMKWKRALLAREGVKFL